MKQLLKAAVLAAALGFAAPVLAQQTVNMPIVIELSGAGAVSGTNFRDGAVMAIEEINAKGGILGRKIVAPQADTQSNPGVSRAQVQKAIDGDPYVILGPVFSGSVKVNMALAQRAEIPQITGAEAADITQAGNPYIFRTSFGQQMSMPKIANYMRDGLKAKTVAVVWVNNDFGKGGRDTFIKEMAARNIKVVADVSTESGQVDFAADVVKVKGANADAIFVYTNEEESARFLREARKQGVKTAADRRDHAARPEGDRARRRRGQRREGPRRPDRRRADRRGARVPREVQEALQLRARPQRHQGLHRRLRGEVRHREAWASSTASSWRRRSRA